MTENFIKQFVYSKGMSRRVALIGTEQDILPLVRARLEEAGHQVVYGLERPGRIVRPDGSYTKRAFEVGPEVNDMLVGLVLGAQPDVTVLCNGQGFLGFCAAYERRGQVPPLVAMTGGGQDMVDALLRFTPQVLRIPQQLGCLSSTVERVVMNAAYRTAASSAA